MAEENPGASWESGPAPRQGNPTPPLEAIPIEMHFPVARGRLEELRHIDRAQIAGLIGIQGLLSTGVRGLDLGKSRGGVRPAGVTPIGEEEAGIPGAPRGLH